MVRTVSALLSFDPLSFILSFIFALSHQNNDNHFLVRREEKGWERAGTTTKRTPTRLRLCQGVG
jgi:hypothetical protein